MGKSYVQNEEQDNFLPRRIRQAKSRKPKAKSENQLVFAFSFRLMALSRTTINRKPSLTNMSTFKLHCML
ncbi:hypothetical protein GGD38_007327 [Chitinophagaceae bacterium OAS944]|nr:hypothetical protein [Chitinophagaceae bacterium OAS944]